MSKMTISHAISTLLLNRPFAYSELQEAIDISIEALKLQIGMKKHCRSHNCNDCRTNGMCAKTFFLMSYNKVKFRREKEKQNG